MEADTTQGPMVVASLAVAAVRVTEVVFTEAQLAGGFTVVISRKSPDPEAALGFRNQQRLH
jgi:hypothetical protein